MKEQSLEEWEKEISSYFDEALIGEFRWYRRMDSGFCPISYEWRLFGLIIREIQKRNLSEKANELVDAKTGKMKCNVCEAVHFAQK